MTGKSSDPTSGRGTPRVDAVNHCRCATQDSRCCAVDQAVAQVPNAKDFIDLLVVRYPRLFRGHSPQFQSFVPGPWQSIVLGLFDDIDSLLDDEAAARFFVSQIRSKYGGLRVYCWLTPVDAGSTCEPNVAAVLHKLVDEAERASFGPSA